MLQWRSDGFPRMKWYFGETSYLQLYYGDWRISDEVMQVLNHSCFPLKVVVKPSGEMWMACMGVSFHVKSDIQSIVGAALRLLRDVQRNDAILVEAFYPTLVPCRSDEGLKERPPWACARSNACRFRATVCRGPDDKAHMTKASHLKYTKTRIMTVTTTKTVTMLPTIQRLYIILYLHDRMTSYQLWMNLFIHRFFILL